LCTIGRICNRCTGFGAVITRTGNVSECLYSLYAWFKSYCWNTQTHAQARSLYLNHGSDLYRAGIRAKYSSSPILVTDIVAITVYNVYVCISSVKLVMAALCNGGPLYFCPVVSFYLSSSFFPRLISAATDWMSTILLHMAWS